MAARDVLNLPGYDMPIAGYTPSPYYTGAQEELSKLGAGLLKGEVPEFYKPLTTIGGPEFEDVLRGVRTDITQGALETGAKLGQRGPAPMISAAREIGRVTPSLRWEEMLRGIGSRRGLLELGAELTRGAGQLGLSEAGQRLGYQQNLASMGLSQRQFEDKLALNREQFTASLDEEKRQFTEQLQFRRERGEISDEQFSQEMALKEKQLNLQAQMWQEQKEQQEAATSASLWSNIISGGLGALGTIGGTMIGGPLGAAAGSAITGGVGGTMTGWQQPSGLPGGQTWSPY